MMSMPAAARWLPLPPIPLVERTFFFTPEGDLHTCNAYPIDLASPNVLGPHLLPTAHASALL